MHFDIASLISFLPQFAVGGIIAAYFYSFFNKKKPEDPEKIEFIVPRTASKEVKDKDEGNTHALDAIMESVGHLAENEKREYEAMASPYSKHVEGPKSILPDAQVLVLSLELWVLLFIALSPIGKLQFLLPSFSRFDSYMLYSALAVVLGISIMSTVTSRLSLSRRISGIAVVVAGLITFLSFYAPSMAWINATASLIHLVIVYSAIVVVCMVAYILSTSHKRRRVFLTSTYATFATYGITSFLLIYNLFNTILG